VLRLLRSLVAYDPWLAASVVALTFALLLTSGVSLLMLVPLLGVAGLEVGDGSIGRLAELAAGVLGVFGLSLTVPVVLGAYLVIVAGSAALGYAHAVRTARLYQGYTFGQRMRVVEAVTASRWAAFVRRPASRFLHVLTEEIERVSGALSGALALVVKVVMAVVYLALALFVSPATTLLVGACGAGLMALLVRKTRLGRVRGAAVSQAYEDLYGGISEHLAGMRISKSHGIEPRQVARLQARTHETAAVQIAVVRNQADLGFWLQIGSATIMAGVFGAALTLFGLPLASILLLLYLYARLVPMLTGLQRQVQGVLAQLPAVDRVAAMLAWLDAHAEPADGGGDAPELTRSLRLDAVSFGYDGQAGAPVLRQVDLVIAAGRTNAVVGPSGGGKSTVADLVVGLLVPDAGRVLVDDAPLEGPRVPAWRRRIGYVNQDTFLFNDTIRANLLLVRPDASEAELLEALRSASASFAETLPDGLDTVVGDRGVRLSGGERQRIALARAILRRPALLVLDEATSALDPENERVIQEAIGRMAGQQTLLVIAHRLASVRGADKIYVMEHGRVVESGTWDELVRYPTGRFRALCEAQGLLDSGARKTANTAGATVG
jgi:ATP-binding cassette, subfamily C, bacterial